MSFLRWRNTWYCNSCTIKFPFYFFAFIIFSSLCFRFHFILFIIFLMLFILVFNRINWFECSPLHLVLHWNDICHFEPFRSILACFNLFSFPLISLFLYFSSFSALLFSALQCFLIGGSRYWRRVATKSRENESLQIFGKFLFAFDLPYFSMNFKR
jgi:hypothetical protein